MSDPLATTHLGLPYLSAAQAQKHVTHNEALRSLDALVQIAVLDTSETDPPATPTEGDRYIVAASGTGGWSGHDGALAAYIDGAWAFFTPVDGWLAFDLTSEALLVFHDDAWTPVSSFLGSIDQLGVNTTADATNRLAVHSNAVLFTGITAGEAGTGDVRFTVNKEADADTASLLFQSGFSGRAEVGLVGDTDFVFKVSANGADWVEAIRIDKDSGLASILYDNTASGLTADTVQDAIDEVAATGDAVASVFGRTGAVAAATSDYDADQIDFTPTGNVSATDVQAAIEELDGEKLVKKPFQATLADDTATSFTPESDRGIVFVMSSHPGHCGVIGVRCDTSPVSSKYGGGGSLNATTGALAGTTGIDGDLNVSSHSDGKIYVENRLGFSATLTICFMPR